MVFPQNHQDNTTSHSHSVTALHCQEKCKHHHNIFKLLQKLVVGGTGGGDCDTSSPLSDSVRPPVSSL